MPTLSTKVNASLTIIHLLQYFQKSVCLFNGWGHLPAFAAHSPPFVAILNSSVIIIWSPIFISKLENIFSWDGGTHLHLRWTIISACNDALVFPNRCHISHVYKNIHSNFAGTVNRTNIADWLNTIIVFFRMDIFDDSLIDKQYKLNHKWDVTNYIFRNISVVTHAATLISPT